MLRINGPKDIPYELFIPFSSINIFQFINFSKHNIASSCHHFPGWTTRNPWFILYVNLSSITNSPHAPFFERLDSLPQTPLRVWTTFLQVAIKEIPIRKIFRSRVPCTQRIMLRLEPPTLFCKECQVETMWISKTHTSFFSFEIHIFHHANQCMCFFKSSSPHQYWEMVVVIALHTSFGNLKMDIAYEGTACKTTLIKTPPPRKKDNIFPSTPRSYSGFCPQGVESSPIYPLPQLAVVPGTCSWLLQPWYSWRYIPPLWHQHVYMGWKKCDNGINMCTDLVISNDYSHYSWTFPLRNKSDTADAIYCIFTS